MRNNKYYKIFGGLLMIVTLASCSKSFLNRNPQDQISSGTFWQTANDAQLGLTGCYAQLQGGYLGYSRYQLEALTDNCMHQYNYNNVLDWQEGNVSPTSGLPSSIWSSSYRGIAACNNFLLNIDKVQMDAATKNTYIGEVHFIRALYYFDLVNFFGDVVVYTRPPTVAEANAAVRTPKADVLTLIYGDLDSAIAALPDVSYAGHAVKGSAEGLKARVYLYNEKWAEAAALCKTITQSGTFSLFSDYGGQFFTKNQPNTEMLFACAYSAPDNLQGIYGGLDIEFGWWASVNPFQAMVDSAYAMTNGKLISDPTSGYDATNPYKNRDPRLLACIKVPGQIWYNPDGSAFGTLIPVTPFQAVKFVDTTLLPINYGDKNKEDEDWVLIRYADILLMYAEATNEATGPSASVFDALDMIRVRAGMPVTNRSMGQSALRTFIRNERRTELAFEGLRYFDLMRWRTAETIIPKVIIPGFGNAIFDASKQYLLPIPQGERNLNPGKLTQNPGYSE